MLDELDVFTIKSIRTVFRLLKQPHLTSELENIIPASSMIFNAASTQSCTALSPSTSPLDCLLVQASDIRLAALQGLAWWMHNNAANVHHYLENVTIEIHSQTYDSAVVAALLRGLVKYVQQRSGQTVSRRALQEGVYGWVLCWRADADTAAPFAHAIWGPGWRNSRPDRERMQYLDSIGASSDEVRAAGHLK